MKQFFTLIAISILLSQQSAGQTLISAQHVGSVSKLQLEQQFLLPFHNGVDRYRVTYTTKDIDGSPTIASGLVCLPDDFTKRYPVLCYQHGTSGTPADVPSNLSFEANFPVALCGQGYVSFAPDYLGLGVSQGIHPYVHAASEAWVAADLLLATLDFAAQKFVEVNDQLFITGYSQGGHAAMAFHRMVELEMADDFTVTASAPMSGPYSIGEVMRDLILSEEEYGRPGYLINTIVSFQYVYGDLFSSFEEAFRPAYVEVVEQFWNGEITLNAVDVALANLLMAEEGAIVPLKLLREEYVAEVTGNPDHPANLRMAENNTYDWAPQAPTRLIYCLADEEVPYKNSTLADSVMNDNGAADVMSINISSTSNHFNCVVVAANAMIDFFKNYQIIEEAPLSATERHLAGLRIVPNPASGRVVVADLPYSGGVLRLFDMQGREMLQAPTGGAHAKLDLTSLPDGLYVLVFSGPEGSRREKLAVRKGF